MSIDWSKPIEAVHEDGRVEVSVFSHFDRDGDAVTTDSPAPQSNVFWTRGGRDLCRGSGWTIRNVTPPMIDLSPETVGKKQSVAFSSVMYAEFAKTFEQADPDMAEAADMLGFGEYIGGFLHHRLAAAIKRGRALAGGDRS